MTPQIAIVLAIVLLTIVLFALERIPLELTSILVVCALGVTGVLTPEQAFAGFSNETVIFIFALLAMSEGLVATGAIDRAGAALGSLSRFGLRGFVFGMMLVVGAVSSIVSNTVTTAAFLPAVIRAARSAGFARSQVLLPLAFASMLGGITLLFGTSTNLVASAAMQKAGLGGIGVTELSRAGLPLALLAIGVMAAFGPKLLPVRDPADAPSLASKRPFFRELLVRPGGELEGQTVEDARKLLGLAPRAVARGDAMLSAAPELVLQPNDRLILVGRRRDILRVEHLDLPHDEQVADPSELLFVEAVVPPSSRVDGLRMSDPFFSERLGVQPIALHRHPAIQSMRSQLKLPGGLFDARSVAELPLSQGDVLIIRGTRRHIDALANNTELMVLEDLELPPPARTGHPVLAVGIVAAAIMSGAVGLLPLGLAGLLGVVAMLLTGCLDIARAFRVDWRVLLLIGSMLALGQAMHTSGAGALLGELSAGAASLGGPRLVLLLLMAITVVLSIPMSNQAAALVMLPVAISAAINLGVDPRAFAIAITLAASCSFMTPLEPSCIMVYGPGNYRFIDFVRVGGPLTLALLIALVVLVPIIWPL